MENKTSLSSSTIPDTQLQLPLFVYGSLMAHEVLEAILKRIPKYVKGKTIANYKRYRVPGEVYPGMVPRTIDEGGSSIEGILLSKNLSEMERYLLDEFEDIQYKKEIIEIEVNVEGENYKDIEDFVECNESTEIEKSSAGKTTRIVKAFCYIWIENKEFPLVEEWSYENHLLPSLKPYVDNAKEFTDYTISMLNEGKQI